MNESCVAVARDGLYLTVSQTLWTEVRHCWRSDVYLAALSHRFWKLSLQLLSRYCFWLDDVIAEPLQDQTAATASGSSSSHAMTKSVTSVTLSAGDAPSKGHRRAGSFGSPPPRVASSENLRNVNGTSASPDSTVASDAGRKFITTAEAVYLINDCNCLQKLVRTSLIIHTGDHNTSLDLISSSRSIDCPIFQRRHCSNPQATW